MKRLTGLLAALTVAGIVASFANGSAQSTPDSENGRYAFAPVVDGVLRLDTRNGRIASCHNRITGWACYIVPDERAALDAEIGLLTKENTTLKSELSGMRAEQQRLSDEVAKLKQAYAGLEAERSKAASVAEPPSAKAGPKQDQTAQKKDNRIELPLPDEKDVERVVSILERAWRNLIAMADRVQKDVSGKI